LLPAGQAHAATALAQQAGGWTTEVAVKRSPLPELAFLPGRLPAVRDLGQDRGL